jgi:predicted RNA methylase
VAVAAAVAVAVAEVATDAETVAVAEVATEEAETAVDATDVEVERWRGSSSMVTRTNPPPSVYHRMSASTSDTSVVCLKRAASNTIT